jgi:hypothetical protein
MVHRRRLNMRDRELDALVASLRDAVEGNQSASDADLAAAAAAVVDRGLLSHLGRAAIEIILHHRLAQLQVRRTILAAPWGVGPWRNFH